ncbi:MAG: caspase family protein [Prosthecobacter sp.]
MTEAPQKLPLPRMHTTAWMTALMWAAAWLIFLPDTSAQEAPLARVPAAAVARLEEQSGGKLEAFSPPRDIPAPQGFTIRAAPSRQAPQVGPPATAKALKAVAVLRVGGEQFYITDYSWNLWAAGKSPNWVLLSGPPPQMTPPASPAKAALTASRGAGGAEGKGRPNLVVLIVANSQYSAFNASITKRFDLPNTHNDADLLATTFRSIGAEVIVVKEAGRPEMSAAVQRALMSLEKDDAFFLHYTGHGFQVGGENYLLPMGVDAQDSDKLLTSCFGLTELFAEITRARPRLSAVVLDCCRDNPFEKTSVPAAAGQGANQGRTIGGAGPATTARRSISSGLAEASAPANTLIAYATSPGKVAYDAIREDDIHSPFAISLSRAVQEGPQEIRQLFAKVGRLTKEYTEGDQTPWLTSDAFAEFYPHYPQRQISLPDADLQMAGRLMRKSETLLEGMGMLSRSLKRQPRGNLAAPALAFALCYQAVPVPLRRIVNDTYDVYRFESKIGLAISPEGWPKCVSNDRVVAGRDVEVYDRGTLGIRMARDHGIISYLKARSSHGDETSDILFPRLISRNLRLAAHLDEQNHLWDVEYFNAKLGGGGNHQVNQRYLTGAVALDEQFLVTSEHGPLDCPKEAVSPQGGTWHISGEAGSPSPMWKAYLNGYEVPRTPFKDESFCYLEWGAFPSANRMVASYDSLEILDLTTGESKTRHFYPYGKDRRIYWPGYNEKYQRLHGIIAYGDGHNGGTPITIDLVGGRMVSSAGEEEEKSGISFKAGGGGEFFAQYHWKGTLYFSDALTGGRILDIPATSAVLDEDGFAFHSAADFKAYKHDIKYVDLPVKRIPISPPLFQFETEWYDSPRWLTLLSDALTGFAVDDLGQLQWQEDASANLAAALHEMRTHTGNRAYQALAAWLLEHKLRPFQTALRVELTERLPQALAGTLGPDNYDRKLYLADALARLSVYASGGDPDEVRARITALQEAGDSAGVAREARRIAAEFPR